MMRSQRACIGSRHRITMSSSTIFGGKVSASYPSDIKRTMEVPLSPRSGSYRPHRKIDGPPQIAPAAMDDCPTPASQMPPHAIGCNATIDTAGARRGQVSRRIEEPFTRPAAADIWCSVPTARKPTSVSGASRNCTLGTSGNKLPVSKTTDRAGGKQRWTVRALSASCSCASAWSVILTGLVRNDGNLALPSPLAQASTRTKVTRAMPRVSIPSSLAAARDRSIIRALVPGRSLIVTITA